MAATCSGRSHPSTRAAPTLGKTHHAKFVHVSSAAVTCHAALCQAALAWYTLVDTQQGTSVLQVHREPPSTHQAAQWPDHSWCSQNEEVRLQACGMPHSFPGQSFRCTWAAVKLCQHASQAREQSACRLQVSPMGNGSGCVWLPNQGTCRTGSERRYANGGSETQGMFYAAWCSWLVQVQALQFEWAWQHPMVSIAVREAASKMSQQAQRGVQGKVRQPVLLKCSTA